MISWNYVYGSHQVNLVTEWKPTFQPSSNDNIKERTLQELSLCHISVFDEVKQTIMDNLVGVS